MRYFIVFFLTILINFSHCTAYSQESQEISDNLLKEIDLTLATKMAVQTSELVKQADNNMLIAGEVVKETLALWMPQINGAATWTNNARYPVNSRYPAGRLGDYKADLGAEVDQVLWAFGKISNAIAAVQEGVDVSKYLDEAKRLDAEYLGKIAFYNLIFADNIYGIIQESYNNARESKKVLVERSSSGRVFKKR